MPGTTGRGCPCPGIVEVGAASCRKGMTLERLTRGCAHGERAWRTYCTPTGRCS